MMLYEDMLLKSAGLRISEVIDNDYLICAGIFGIQLCREREDI